MIVDEGRVRIYNGKLGSPKISKEKRSEGVGCNCEDDRI